jgi:phosphopantetheine adenylyltransferase
VLVCVNPGKSNNIADVKKYASEELSKILPNNQVEFYEGMLHNYVKSKKYPLSIVKGLRNASDFDSEKLQLRYMEDMMPDINIVYIVSDRKYEHVSSSGIKSIQGMGAVDEAKVYLPEVPPILGFGLDS